MCYNINYTIIFIQLHYGSEAGAQFIPDSLLHADVQLVSLCHILKLQVYVKVMNQLFYFLRHET
jgi:hypothetical protein